MKDIFGIKPDKEQKEVNVSVSVIMVILSSLASTCYIDMDIILQYRIMLSNYALITSRD